jgi:PBSX family phage portal protein
MSKSNKSASSGVKIDLRDIQVQSRVVKREAYGTDDVRVLKAMEEMMAKRLPDPFQKLYLGIQGSTLTIIQPTYFPQDLMVLPLVNNTLGQCITAMEVNIHGFGHTLEYIGKDEEKNSKAVQDEKARIEDLLEQPNEDDSLITLRRKVCRDYETLGYAAIEVGRDPTTGAVEWFAHVPANTVRMTKQEREPVTMEIMLKRGEKYKPVTVRRRFRRFVQIVNERRVWFKEFGDTRVVDYKTGGTMPDNVPLDVDEQATEIIWLSQYVMDEAYGQPRWINQLPAILGSRESELTNLQFFKDNAIPAMAILVSGGMLTEESVKDIQKAFSEKGLDSMNRVLILEAKPNPDDTSVDGSPIVPSLSIQPLRGERQSDELFQDYDKNNRDKIRSAFRLPSLFIGMTQDHTHAVAEASLATAESQIFTPERTAFDKIINDKILSVKGVPPLYWKFRSNPAKIVSSEDIVNSLEAFDAVGAMTPNVARRLLNEMYGLNVPMVEEEWGDLPFSITNPKTPTLNIGTSGESEPKKAKKPKEEDAPTQENPNGKGGKASEKPEPVVTARERFRSKPPKK